MGTVEVAVMAAIITLREDAYGVRIHQDVESQLGRSVAIGQIYVSLTRLKQKGFLKTETGDATPVRGGRAKTFYLLTGKGARAWESERARMRSLSGLRALAGGA